MTEIIGINKVEEKIRLLFEGDKSIGVETLLASLEYTNTTLKAVKNNVAGISDYQVVIEPFQEGSFIVDITLFVYAASELLPTIKSMGGVLLETIRIWKTLNGRPAQQIIRNQIDNNIEITGDNNTVIVVSPEALKVVTDSKKIAQDISDLAKKVLKDSTKSGSILCSVENNKTVHSEMLEDSNLKEIKTPVFIKESLSEKSITIDHIIIKPSIVNFEKIDEWKFSSSYSDKPFKAKIDDKEFCRKVVEGEIAFGNETRMKVVMQTVETLLKDGSSKKTYDYTIIKVEQLIDHEKVAQISAELSRE